MIKLIGGLVIQARYGEKLRETLMVNGGDAALLEEVPDLVLTQ